MHRAALVLRGQEVWHFRCLQAEPLRPLSPRGLTIRLREVHLFPLQPLEPEIHPQGSAAGIERIFKRTRPERRIAGAGVPLETHQRPVPGHQFTPLDVTHEVCSAASRITRDLMPHANGASQCR